MRKFLYCFDPYESYSHGHSQMSGCLLTSCPPEEGKRTDLRNAVAFTLKRLKRCKKYERMTLHVTAILNTTKEIL